ncbi:MAG TPA: AzlC family ABC transporter permease [Thermoleophilaceae bacterium]|nr:AzlC family ABC transporter permease [Thermoleophilaceae bacterium]
MAVGLFGVSFGVLAGSAGFEPLAAVVMSVTTFAGSAQFAAISVLGAGGTLAAAVGAAVLLNARYGPMGLAAAPAFEGSVWRRLLQSQLVVDEAWALSIVEEERGRRFDRRILVGAGLLLYAAWVAGTTAGVIAGGALGDPEDLGLDAAFPALFLALLVGQLGSRPAATAALVGGAIALVLIPVAPAGVPVIVAVAACLIGLRGREERS